MGGILGIPAMLFLFAAPDLGAWSHRIEVAAYIFIFSFCSIGCVVAVLLRTGGIQITYSDSDKHTLCYRISKWIAELD